MYSHSHVQLVTANYNKREYMSIKRLLITLISLIMVLGMPLRVSAVTSSEVKKQKAETEKAMNAANSKAEALEGEMEGIEDEINELDEQLVEVMAAVSMVEDEIHEIEEQIQIAMDDYDAAKAEEQRQYEEMKLRIKFMYEKGNYSYVQMLVEAKNLSDMVNKTDYIEKLYEYDRKMLLKYQAAKQAVADAWAALEEEQSELQASQHELEEEQAALDELLAEKKAQAEDYENQITKAKQEAAAYKAKIKQQNAQIKQLEEEEERKRQEEEAKKNASSSSSSKKYGSAYNLDSVSVINSSGGSASGKEVASYACQFVGNPYVPGGTSLTNGADCSGFTLAVYNHFGYSLPRSSTSQRSAGREVSYADAQPGDIICYAGHVAIYIGGGRIVHASTQATGIKYGVATYKPIICVRRIVN